MKSWLSHRGLWYLVAAVVLMVIGLYPFWLAFKIAFYWGAIVCLYISVGYYFNFARLLFKRSTGKIPLLIKWLLLPYFLFAHLYNWHSRRISTTPPFQQVYPGLFIGRRVLISDLEQLKALDIHAVLDVTAEFDVLGYSLLNTGIEYKNVPIFDHNIPGIKTLHSGVDQISRWKQQGKHVLVHCALGQGRSAMLILAYLIYKNPRSNIDRLLTKAQSIRSTISPNKKQLRLLKKYQVSDFVQKRKLHICIILNPISGGYEGEEQLDEIVERLQAFYNVHVERTKVNVSAKEIAERSVKAGINIIVACGGDGTVSEVAEALVGTHCTLGIIPMGTANALASCLYGSSIVEDVSVYCEKIINHHVQAIDTARCNGKAVILLAGVGIESGMVQRADSEFKKKWGVLAYVAGAIKELSDYKSFKVKLKFDGDEHESEIDTYSLVVANAAPLTSIFARGGGEPLLDDGKLDITWLESKKEPAEVFYSLFEIFQQEIQQKQASEYVHHQTATSLNVRFECEVPVTIDGEIFHYDQLNFEVLEKSLYVIR